MNFIPKNLQFTDNEIRPILDKKILLDEYCRLDLSISNGEIRTLDIADYRHCQNYIDSVLEKNKAKVAYGGYLEKRNLYSSKSNFSDDGNPRNIHLGIDFWAKEGTDVIAPLDGEVHSFQNNSTSGDYGPTIILQHRHGKSTFHTLYGHLSLQSLKDLYVGKKFRIGEVLATLGTPEINVNYAPHLHFQVIRDMQGKTGDYPGVCTEKDLEYYSRNCPDPDHLLKMTGTFSD